MRRVGESRPRRRADAERNIAAILDAAVTLLTEDPDVSMAEVAREAGVGRVTLYAHFPSRAELIEAVVDRVLAEASGMLDLEGLDTEPADRMLVRLARSSWHTLHRFHRLRAVASAELGDEGLRARHDRAGLTDRLADLVSRGQREGTVRADLPADWLIAVYYSLMHSAAAEVGAGRLEPDEVPDLVEATLLPMVSAASAAGSPSGSGSA